MTHIPTPLGYARQLVLALAFSLSALALAKRVRFYDFRSSMCQSTYAFVVSNQCWVIRSVAQKGDNARK